MRTKHDVTILFNEPKPSGDSLDKSLKTIDAIIDESNKPKTPKKVCPYCGGNH